MRELLALSVAIELLHTPSRVWTIRSAPLPSGVDVILEIAAGNAEVQNHAAEITGRSAVFLRKAAAFFIEQILFYSEADSYRILGVNPQATSSELRHNMALLLKWLHPDLGRQEMRSLYATNVTNAWNDLKSEERRALYDSARLVKKNTRRRSRAAKTGSTRNKLQVRWGETRPNLRQSSDQRTLLSRLWLLLFGRTGL
jgi:hypothetical protein